MKKLLLLAAFVATAVGAKPPQQTAIVGMREIRRGDTLYYHTPPSFMGGDINTFATWPTMRVKYPEDALRDGIQGVVKARFIVEADGSVSNVEILSSPHSGMSSEVVNAIRRSPRWAPGIQGPVKLVDGTVLKQAKAVRVRLEIPVYFALDKGGLLAMNAERMRGFEGPIATWDQALMKPTFLAGGPEKFAQWLLETAKLPKSALKNGPVRVGVMMVVEPDGTMSRSQVLGTTNIKLKKGIEDALLVAPRWQPGADAKGEPIRTQMFVPVVIVN